MPQLIGRVLTPSLLLLIVRARTYILFTWRKMEIYENFTFEKFKDLKLVWKKFFGWVVERFFLEICFLSRLKEWNCEVPSGIECSMFENKYFFSEEEEASSTGNPFNESITTLVYLGITIAFLCIGSVVGFACWLDLNLWLTLEPDFEKSSGIFSGQLHRQQTP